VAYTAVETKEDAKARQNTKNQNSVGQGQVSLWWLVVLGFVGSLALVAGLSYVFAAYTTHSFTPWDRQPPLTTEEQFGVLRNAVTAAAALGVGVTLLLTYRRQRATEANLTITNSLLELQQRQHEIQVVSDLRERYSLAAEQLGSDKLPLAIAGVHSIESLTDEWYEQKNDVERQNCVSLLTEFLKLGKSSENVPDVRTLITRTILGRLRDGLAEGRYWALNISMAYQVPAEIIDLYVNGVTLDLRGLRAVDHGDYETGFMSKWRMVAGDVNLTDLNLDMGSLHFQESVFEGGTVTLHMDESRNHQGQINFRDCVFRATDFKNSYDSRDSVALTFTGCAFEGGTFSFPTYQRPKAVSFLDCRFEENIFLGDEENSGFIHTELFVKNCEFADGVEKLESRRALEAPKRDYSAAFQNIVMEGQSE
jgi:hypothetical protein